MIKISYGGCQQATLSDSITVQPQEAFVCDDEVSVDFIVGSLIPNVSFEWQYYNPDLLVWESIPDDDTDFIGQASDTLTVFSLNDYDKFSFRCKLQLLFGSNDIIISDNAQLNIILPPVANFSYEYPCEDTTIFFKDLSVDPNGLEIKAWQWEFDDSEISLLQDPAHIYTGAADYLVKLTVWNEYDCSDQTQQTIKIIPFTPILISGPEVICGNQTSNYSQAYYTFDSIKDNCEYRWILPEFDLYLRDTTRINETTLRIDWKALEESTQVMLQVEEWLQLPGGLECKTGSGFKDVLIIKKTALDQGKIIPKAEDKAILLYLGDSASVYQWGYTKNAFDADVTNDDTIHIKNYNSNYCDFGELNSEYLYWVETIPESWMECWTRTYYNSTEKSSFVAASVKILPNPTSGLLYLENHSISESIKEISIISLDGKLMNHISYIDNDESCLTIDVSKYNDGIYFLEIQFHSGYRLYEKVLVNPNK